jgi:hypothetical protein
MKTKHVKLIDLGLQLAALLFVLVALLLKQPNVAFCGFYFGLGAIQLCSALLHWGFGRNPYLRHDLRKPYLKELLWVFLLGLFCLFLFLIMHYLLFMLLVGLIMAIQYLCISFQETMELQHDWKNNPIY